MKIKEETKKELERIVNLGNFQSKVATTVLNTCKMSPRQQEILNQVSLFFIEQEDFIIDATNLKHDDSFENMQNKSRNNQAVGLTN